VNESIDVATENDVYGIGDAIEYRQRAFWLNGLLWKGKPPALPFIAPEKVQEIPLRIALDESYRYVLEGTETQAGRSCYRISFAPIADGADFRGTVWIDRSAFFRVRMDLVRLRPSPPATSDVMTQWFEPRPAGDREYWLLARTVGQMSLMALGRSIVLRREVGFTDIVVNPEGFDEHRRDAHRSQDPMFRDSIDEGLVALGSIPGAGERIAHSATTKSNTMLVGSWGGNAAGDVSLPFGGINWFDLDFRNTGTQVDLAWAGPAAVLSASRPIPDSAWQVSVDSIVTALPRKDRYTDLGGRISAQDLKRQEQQLAASFRRNLGSYCNISVGPGLTYMRTTRASGTDPAYLLPPGTLEEFLGLRFEYQHRGYELGLWARGTRRESWTGFGLPGDASRIDVRDTPLHYGLQLHKSFHSSRLHRFAMELDLWDGEDLDRFSAFGTKDFPGLRIRGYESAGLRFTRGVTSDVRYAMPPMGKIRFELAAGGAVFQNPESYGDGTQHAYGASVAATFPGAWGTFVRVRVKQGIDSSLPLDGSDGSLRLELFRTFDGWWPWTRSARSAAR
jgi:hypothetical protein